MVASAFYSPECHELFPLGQWLVQPHAFSLEKRGLWTVLGILGLRFAWNSSLYHLGAPKLAHSFCGWPFLAVPLLVKGMDLFQTIRDRALMILHPCGFEKESKILISSKQTNKQTNTNSDLRHETSVGQRLKAVWGERHVRKGAQPLGDGDTPSSVC